MSALIAAERTIPKPQDLTEKEFIYKRAPEGELKLIVTYPAGWKASDQRPGVIFFSGGAWASSIITQFNDRADYLAGRGMIAVRADYRVSKIHKTGPDKAVEDARTAVRWLRQHAGELGLDPDRVATGGSSAGGHLAACCGVPNNLDDPTDDLKISCIPNAVILISCVTNASIEGKEEAFAMKVGGGAEMARKLSPFQNMSAKTPPTLVMCGMDDHAIENAKKYGDKAKELKIRCDVYGAPGQPHPFSSFSPWKEATASKMDEFFASLGWLTGPPTVTVPKGGEFARYQPGEGFEKTEKPSADSTARPDERLQQFLRKNPEADLNKDGKLDANEFREFRRKQGK